MKDPLFQKCFHAIKSIVPEKSRLLLAFSGGLDSTALFHLLREAKKLYAFELECVHIDHRWRSESHQEANRLKKYVTSFALPFHSRPILEKIEERNKEERYRILRYTLIKEVYDERKADFLLTAHQGDDQAETVVKRLFEGASLLNIGGLQEVRELFGMHIFRPLLGCFRKELHEYLIKNHYTYIDDSTNYDTTYTRARTRHELIPLLERQFGKGIKKNLCRLAKESNELCTSLWQELDEHVAIADPYIPWSVLQSLSFHQVYSVIQRLFPDFSADEKTRLVELVKKRSIGKKVKYAELTRQGVKRGDKF